MAWWDPVSDTYCRNCKRSPEVVYDHAGGHIICSECGLVLSDRTFADESSGSEPSRVGGDPFSALIADSPPTTALFALGPAAGGLLVRGKWQRRGCLAFKRIADMADRLGLSRSVKERANEIYKMVEDKNSLKGRNQGAVAAACLYVACRQENKPCTVKEISSVAADVASKREIGRAKQLLLKQLELEGGRSVGMGTIHAADYLRRYCLNLGLTNAAVKAAQEIVQKINDLLDIRRSPTSVAAAVVYIITQLSAYDMKPMKEITVATQVTELTIRNTCKDMHPHLKQIVPTWFANEEDISSLLL